MTLVRIDGLPVNHSDFITDGKRLYQRKNVEPFQTERRTGSTRLHTTRPSSLGISSHPDLNGVVLLDDQYQAALKAVFAPGGTSTDWTINFHMTPGALSVDNTLTRDFTLFRWGDTTEAQGHITVYLRTSGTTLTIVAEVVYTSGTDTLTEAYASLPDPDDAIMVTLICNGTTLTMYLDEVAQAPTATVGAKTITDVWTETSLLGRSLRAGAATNTTPAGERPTITDLSIWDSVVTLTGMSGTRLTTAQQADANLKVYLPLNDGAYLETAEGVSSGRAFLAPAPPLIDATEGAVFSGDGGFLRIPWSPTLDPFFSRRISSSTNREWSLSLQFTTPKVMDYPDGNATLCQWGPDGLLLLLEILDIGSSEHQVKATVGHGGGSTPVTSTINSGTGLVADTLYQITISREDDDARLVVNANDTTASGLSAVGPTLNEADLPEIIFGAAYNTSTEAWGLRFRGKIRSASLWPFAVPLTAHSSTGVLGLNAALAVFYHDFRNARGDQSKDQGQNGITALYQVEDRSGTQSSAPFWTAGAIPDGSYVAAKSGLALTTARAAILSATPTVSKNHIKGYLRRSLGADAVVARVGEKAIVVSNSRAHLIDEQARRIRPLGLPAPTARPGIFESSFGPVDGMAAYAYTYVSRDATESPIKILEPQVFRNATVGIGGGAGLSGAIYGDNGSTGYWQLIDTLGGGTFDNLGNGTYTQEVRSRIDTTINSDDLRERVFDRGVIGDSSYTVFWGSSGDPGLGDIKVNGPFTLQVAFRYGASPGADTEAVLASIGLGHILDADDKPALVLVTINGSAGAGVNPHGDEHSLTIYKAAGDDLSANGYTAEFFTTTNLVVGKDYNVVIVHDGTNWEAWINNVKDATTGTGGQHDASGSNSRILLGASTNSTEPDAGNLVPAGDLNVTNVVKGNKSAHWYMCRFWNRALPDADIPSLDFTWFDPQDQTHLEPDLVRDWLFATDDPWGKKQVFDCRRSGDSLQFKKTPVGNDSVKPDQQWDVDGSIWNGSSEIHEGFKAASRFYTARIDSITALAADWQNSCFALMFSRIGNGSYFAHAGDNLVYFAANETMDDATPALPADPQGWNWWTWTIVTADEASDATLNVKNLWLNSQRVYSGGVDFDRDSGGTKTADIAGWELGQTNAFEAHVSEFRTWNTEKYTSSEDFEWLFRRVTEDDHDELVYLYDFDSAASIDITNKGTAGNPTPDALDGVAPATMTTNSSLALPIVPIPDIVVMRFYRTLTLPIVDFNDEDELDRLRRISREGPFFFVGAAPIGTQNFVDSTPNELLGAPARHVGGFTPLEVSGVATWDAVPVLWGDPLRPLNLYVADPLDFESYDDERIIRVPAVEFHEVVACVQAGPSFYVFGNAGGLRYRGSPYQHAPPLHIGGGVGADSAQCIAADGNIVYVWSASSGLWAIADDQKARLDQPVHDQTPSAGNGRLELIGDQLHLIDTSDGHSLVYHLGLKQWRGEWEQKIESGSFRSSTKFLVHKSGFLAQGDSGYADDLISGQTATGTVTGGDSTSILDSTNPWPTTGDGMLNQWARLVRATDGSTELVQISANTAGDLTVGTISGTAPASGDAWHIGAYEVLVDTGVMDLGLEQTLIQRGDLGRFNSDAWEMGYDGSHDPGDPTSEAALTYVTLATSGALGIDGHARFQRLTLRHLQPEQASVSGWWMDVQASDARVGVSPDA